MGFLLMNLDEFFRKASSLYSLTADTIKKVVRTVHVLPDSKKRLGGQADCMMWFLLMNLDEIFSKASSLYSLTADTIKKVERNVHVLPDSQKRLGGQAES